MPEHTNDSDNLFEEGQKAKEATRQRMGSMFFQLAKNKDTMTNQEVVNMAKIMAKAKAILQKEGCI